MQLHQQKRSKSSLSDEWETPWDLYFKLCNEYKICPVLDVCATSYNTKCKIFFTKETDGLKAEWTKPVWANVPQKFAQKFIHYCPLLDLFMKVNKVKNLQEIVIVL